MRFKLIFIISFVFLPINTYATINVDATPLFRSFSNNISNLSTVYASRFLDQVALSFGGITHSIKSGWNMMIGKRNNQCEAARQAYLLRQQIFLLDKLKEFSKKTGGGIPQYDYLLDTNFLQTIGMDGNGVAKFLPPNVNEHPEYNELVNFIFRLRFNVDGAKDNAENYVNYLNMLIRFYEKRKGDNPIPTMPEKIEDEEKEKQACDNPNRKSLGPNSNIKSKADSDITTTQSFSNPFDKQNPEYKGNFYQLPVFTMVQKNSAKKDWQLCSCAYIADLSSNSSFGKNSSGIGGLESFVKDVNRVIDTVSSPTKIMEQLQLGWEHLKKLIYAPVSSSTEKKKVPTLEEIAEKYTSRLQKSWNDNVSKQINDLKYAITSTYEKNGAFGVLGKFVNVNVSINSKTKYEFSLFNHDKNTNTSRILQNNQRIKKINDFQLNTEKEINKDINENINTLDEENFFAKAFNFIQSNTRYYINDIKKALFTTNKVDSYMGDHNDLPPHYDEYKNIK